MASNIEIIPADRVISPGLTPVPTLPMRAMFAPFPANYKHNNLHTSYHTMGSGIQVEIQSCGLNVQTDFGIFAKVMQCIADKKLHTGELVAIPFSEFKEKSVHIDLNGGKRSRIRLSNSLQRLQSIKVSYSDGNVSEGTADKWISHIAFNSIGFDFSSNCILIQCNDQLAEWYHDSFKQILVEQFNQIDKFYSKAVYLYLESINGSAGGNSGISKELTVKASTLRDIWFRQEIENIKDPRKKRDRKRHCLTNIIEAFDDLRYLQYFEEFKAVESKDKNNDCDMTFIFRKKKRKKRERLVQLSDSDIDTDDLIASGMVVKPERSRLPKRKYPLDDVEHIAELKDWAIDCYMILTKYESDLMDYNSKGLLHRDRKTLESVTKFLLKHGVKLKSSKKSPVLATGNLKKLHIKRDKILDRIKSLESEIAMKSKLVFDIDDAVSITAESDEFVNFLNISKAASDNWESAKKELDAIEQEINAA